MSERTERLAAIVEPEVQKRYAYLAWWGRVSLAEWVRQACEEKAARDEAAPGYEPDARR